MIGNLKLNSIRDDFAIEEVRTSDIAIIGIDLNIPGAASLDELWKVLADGCETIGYLSEHRQEQVKEYLRNSGKDISNYEPIFGGYLDSIDRFDFNYFKCTPKEAELMNPAQRMLLESVKRMIDSAGYTQEDFRGTNTGVYIGMIGDVGIDKYKAIISQNEDKSLFQIAATGNLGSIASGRISYFWDLKGPSILVDTACSSSLVALHMACSAVRNGECSQAVVGGINLDIIPLKDEIKVGFESKSNRTRPFSDNADGTVAGEGIITVLIKPLEDAVEAKDNILAVIKGSAVNQDGFSMGITVPNSAAQENVILKAWENAGINAEKITYIEAHGTGTILGDPIEVEGISGAFSKSEKAAHSCAIGSVKGNVGHLYGAAGLIGVVKCILAMNNKMLPPSINFDIPNSRIDFGNSPIYVNDRLTQWNGYKGELFCGVSSFGFSGTNCHMVLRNYEEPKRNDCGKMLFVVSAESPKRLAELVDEYRIFLSSKKDVQYQDICFTSCIGRKHDKYRAAAVVSCKEEMLEAVDNLHYSNELNDEQSKAYTRLYADNADQLNDNNIAFIMDCYLNGADIPWGKVLREKDVHRTVLPIGEFQGQQCWVKLTKDMDARDVRLTGNDGDSYSEVEVEIGNIIMEVLGISEIDVNRDITDYGGDSIMLTSVLKKIDKRYPGIVTLSQMFVYSSVNKLAQYISNACTERNADKYSAIGDQAGQKADTEGDIDDIFSQLESGETSLEEALKKFINS